MKIPPQYHLPELRGRPQYDSFYLPQLNSPAEFNGAARQARKKHFSCQKSFFAWLKPLHDLDLLCLHDLINPWELHFFAVIIILGNLLNTEAAYGKEDRRRYKTW